jgi:protein gp37
MISWNPWHGCAKYSEGCMNCYVYRMDKHYGRDPQTCNITQAFDLPVKKNRYGEYKYPSGTFFFTCYTSDFFLDKADNYRDLAWMYMKERYDCYFMIITKRVDMISTRLPFDWLDGYPNVEIVCTIENQRQADYRLPIYLSLPIKHKSLCIEPMISYIDIDMYLQSGQINHVICGGESGYGDSIRPCYESWVIDLYNQCTKYNIPFCFKQTGTKFITLDEELHTVARKDQMKVVKNYNLNTPGFRIDLIGEKPIREIR